MKRLVCTKIDVPAIRLIYIVMYAVFSRDVNTHGYVKEYLLKLKERIISSEEYGYIDKVRFSTMFENGRYGVSIQLAFLPQSNREHIVKAMNLIVTALSELDAIEMVRDDEDFHARTFEEWMYLEPAMVLEECFKKSNKPMLLKRLVTEQVRVLYTSNIPKELEQYLATISCGKHGLKPMRWLFPPKGVTYIQSTEPFCMIMAFVKVNHNNFFEWKMVETLLSVLVFEVARTEYGMAYDLSCDLDYINRILCVQAGLGIEDAVRLEEILSHILHRIVNENYAYEKLEGMKRILVIAFAQLWDSPEDLLEVNDRLSCYDLHTLSFGEIEKRIGDITWEHVKRRVQEVAFSYKICWSYTDE